MNSSLSEGLVGIFPPCLYIFIHNYGIYEGIPLFSVEEGEDMLAGHEALLNVTQLQVVHLQHVLLLFLLQGETKTDNYFNAIKEKICKG